MNCSACSSPLPPGAAFCARCGQRATPIVGAPLQTQAASTSNTKAIRLILALVLGIPALLALLVVIVLTLLGGKIRNEFDAANATIAANAVEMATPAPLATPVPVVIQSTAPPPPRVARAD